MGSGSSSSYSGGGSQPYAPSYHVTPEMKQYDINNGTYHDGKYDKNPTARKLVDAINGDYFYSSLDISKDLDVIKLKYSDMSDNYNKDRLALLPEDIQKKLTKKYGENIKLLKAALEETNEKN